MTLQFTHQHTIKMVTFNKERIVMCELLFFINAGNDPKFVCEIASISIMEQIQ